MKLNKRKGFTIVELVIVIAVIAILAAVLIPNISNLVKKANASADESLVRNLNTALSMDVEKHQTMDAALEAALKNGGYELTTIVTKNKDNKILWDSKNDCFVYLNGNTIKYLPNTKEVKDVKDWDYFEILDKLPDGGTIANTQKYSVYLAGDAYTGTVVTPVGFDAGKNAVSKITFATEGAVSALINTNGGELVVNATNANVEHRGEATIVTIEAVATASYHENGKVNEIKLEKGRVVVEAKAEVGSILVTAKTVGTASDGTKTVSVEVKDNASLGAVGTKENITLSEIVKGASENQIVGQIDNSNFAGGFGTEKAPYLISNVQQLLNVKSDKNVYYKLIADLEVAFNELKTAKWFGHDWYSYYCINRLQGVLDGNGHSIKLPETAAFDSEKSSVYASLIYKATDATVENLILIQGNVVCDATCVTIQNVTTKGDLTFANNAGVFVGNAYKEVTLLNCRNEANVNSYSYSAVFVGYVVTSETKLTFKNCFNVGQYIGVKSALFLGNKPDNDFKVELVVTNCGNSEGGSVRATDTSGSYVWNSYIAMGGNLDATVTLTLNGVPATLNNFVSNGFTQGPNDTLALLKNGDKTLTIKKSSISNVSYYVVTVGIYAHSNSNSGTQMFNVEERLDVTSGDITTTIKAIPFTAQTNMTQKGTLLNWNIVTDGTSEYYLFDKDGYHISEGQSIIVNVIAYDVNGNVLSSAILSK